MDVVLYFSAVWCGPCKSMSRTVKQLAQENPDIEFRKIDIDDDPTLAAQHGVRAMPTLIYLTDNQEVARVVGAQTVKQVATQLSLQE